MLFVFGKLKLKKWQRLSSEMRAKVYQAIEKKSARKQNRKAIKVVINYDSDFSSAGMFVVDNGRKVIYLQEYYVLDNDRRFAGLYTILHEGRHAYQYVKAVEKEPRWYEFTKRRWRTNWKAYVSSKEDDLLYENQVLERDADSYAIKAMKALRFKYRKEVGFKEILQARIDKYENDGKLATEKYGFFAKWFINFKIRRRAKKRDR